MGKGIFEKGTSNGTLGTGKSKGNGKESQKKIHRNKVKVTRKNNGKHNFPGTSRGRRRELRYSKI